MVQMFYSATQAFLESFNPSACMSEIIIKKSKLIVFYAQNMT